MISIDESDFSFINIKVNYETNFISDFPFLYILSTSFMNIYKFSLSALSLADLNEPTMILDSKFSKKEYMSW